MTKRLLVSSMLIAISSLLASCSGALTCGNSHPYATNAARPPLVAPPGVTVPDPDPAYRVPAASTAAKPVAAPAASTGPLAQPCLVTPPSVLTQADMNASPRTAAPPKPTVPIGTHPSSSGNPPPVAGRGSME